MSTTPTPVPVPAAKVIDRATIQTERAELEARRQRLQTGIREAKAALWASERDLDHVTGALQMLAQLEAKHLPAASSPAPAKP